MSLRVVIRLALAAGVVLAACALPAAAQGVFNETRPGVWGEVADEQGNPVPDLPIKLARNVEGDPGFVMKSTKKGTFIFPQLELFEAGYVLTIDSPEWYIRKYHIRTRRGTREISRTTRGRSIRRPRTSCRSSSTAVRTRRSRWSWPGSRSTFPGRRTGSGRGAGSAEGELTPAEKADEAAALGDYAAAIEILGPGADRKAQRPRPDVGPGELHGQGRRHAGSDP